MWHNSHYLPYTIFRFYLIDFRLNTLPNFAFLTLKSPSITQWSVSQENAFKKEQKPVGFSSQNYKRLK